jgi:hypothetical protein
MCSTIWAISLEFQFGKQYVLQLLRNVIIEAVPAVRVKCCAAVVQVEHHITLYYAD